MLEEFANDLLLFDELNICEGIPCKSDGLVEALVLAIGDIYRGDDDVLEPLVEPLIVLHFHLELGRTSNYNTLHIWHVVCDEILSCHLTTFVNISCSFFKSKTSKSHGRLTTTTVLFRQLN